MNNLMLFYYAILFLVQDTTAKLDTTAFGYKVGIYIGSFLPFIGLLIIFLLIIRSRYRFRSKEK